MFKASEWRQDKDLENGYMELRNFSEKYGLSGNCCCAHRTCSFYTKTRGLGKHLNYGGHPVVDLDIWHKLHFEIKILKCENNVLQYLLSTCDMQSSFLLGNPNSVMSPASSGQSEEQQYLEKLKQLSKYIEPLRRMINKIDKNEGEVSYIWPCISLCQLSYLLKETVLCLLWWLLFQGLKMSEKVSCAFLLLTKDFSVKSGQNPYL